MVKKIDSFGVMTIQQTRFCYLNYLVNKAEQKFSDDDIAELINF